LDRIRRNVISMLGVRVRESESFEGAKRRFKRQVEKSGKMADWRKKEYYVPPSQLKKRANAQAEKRHRKRLQRESKMEQERKMRVRGRGASGSETDAYVVLQEKINREGNGTIGLQEH
jgi:small subunit ribosomal protein S21